MLFFPRDRPHSYVRHHSLTCNNHIGMGVRYNAEKKKIGNYYTTPIYSFRCKCHLCDGWFEIQTDPKVSVWVDRVIWVNAALRSQTLHFRIPLMWLPLGLANRNRTGTQKKMVVLLHMVGTTSLNDISHFSFLMGVIPITYNIDWFFHPLSETNASSSGVTDAFASVERTTAAESNLNNVIKPRLSSLAELSDRRNQDPYRLSSKLRRSFREIKKVDKRIRDEEDSVRDKFALPKELDLVKEDEVREEAKEMWERGRTEWIREEDKKRKVFDSQFGSLGLNKPIPLSSATKRTTTAAFGVPPPKRPRSVPSTQSAPMSTLASTILRNSLKHRNPFSVTSSASGSRMPAQAVGVISKK